MRDENGAKMHTNVRVIQYLSVNAANVSDYCIF